MGTLVTYTIDELSDEAKAIALQNVKDSTSYKAYYSAEFNSFSDRVFGEESNELLEANEEYTITDTDILISSVYEDGSGDGSAILSTLYSMYILGDVSVYENQTFTVKVNYDTEPIRELVNTFQEDIKTWADGVLDRVGIRQEEFTEEFFSDYTVTQYIRENNYIFTEDGQRIYIN